MRFFSKLFFEIGIVLVGVCVGTVLLAKKDLAAWRKRRGGSDES
jgi:hypothetical protein